MAVGLSDRETRRNVLCATRGKRLRGKKQEKSGRAKVRTRAVTHRNAPCTVLQSRSGSLTAKR